MVALALTGLIALLSGDRVPASCDLIERNHTADHLDQYIWWDLRDGEYWCEGWTDAKRAGPLRRVSGQWVVTFRDRDNRIVCVSAPAYMETWTRHVPEVMDRERYPENQRRGIR